MPMTEIVAIPALGCTARLYGEIASLLAGEADIRTAVATGDRMEACVAEVLAMAPERFVLLGTSFGGRVALETTLAAPERVQGLVVIGSGVGPVADRAVGLHRGARMRGGEFTEVVAEMGRIISHLPGPLGESTRQAFISMAHETGPEIMARQSDALAYRGDLWPRLGTITCPVLCLWGDHDQFVPAADGLRLSQAVAHGRFAEIADCGHFPSLEWPAECAAAISHWLADHPVS